MAEHLTSQQVDENQTLNVDALGKPFITGPSDEEAAPGIEFVQRWTREVGQIAARLGVGQLVLLGMLDEEGFGLNEVVEALEMSGQVEAVDVGVPADESAEIRLVQTGDSAWEQVSPVSTE